MDASGTLGRAAIAAPATMDASRNEADARGVLRFITAGSVDDGKSTLIGRLLHDTQAVLEDQLAAVAHASRRRGFAQADLSLLTDGLEAEREQGITIDVAYRYFATARRKFIIADTPGHEQYTRNMVTGASTADAAVILIDARKGLLPQSKRHLLIAHLLGIRHVIVAVNKMDLVGYGRGAFEALTSSFAQFAESLAIPDLRFIPVSAMQGDMVVERGDAMPWYEGPSLLEALEDIDPADLVAAAPFRFPVQWVARPDASFGGRGYMGRVAAESVLQGSEVVVLPSGLSSRIRSILVHGGERAFALAGDSVTLTLTDELDISRGDMVVDAQHVPAASKAVRARLCWLAEEPPAPSGRYLLRHTTRTVKAKLGEPVARLDVHTLQAVGFSGTVSMNDIFDAPLSLAQPIFADSYGAIRPTGAFILIDEASNHTVAAGLIE